MPHLRNHLLARLRGIPINSEFSDEERRQFQIYPNRIIKHKVLRVNYTTYDVRREQDSLNPRCRADIMLLNSNSDGHPYRYAQLLGIYHVMARDLAAASQATRKMVFLHVRWYELDTTGGYAFGWTAKRLPRLRFVPFGGSVSAFGFVDPAHVIRASHIVPAFHYGQTNEYLGSSAIARSRDDDNVDWLYHYVNM
jgi:hypothetical protein